ncbi:MAG TPA: acetyl-CoA carboxylase biotin carboxyl carrier protein subunit [Stellaceae bacterium]|nr:acetyl-CoA carboxylase biotin carboxyl carrier protein subunit [Stellaceae bacterium]
MLGGRRPPLTPDPDLIRSLAKLLDETGLTEIEYAVGDQRIHVSRHITGAAPAVAAATWRQQAAPAIETPAPLSGGNGAGHPGANGHDHPGTLKAPLVGIAYLAAEPGQPPYVRVGDAVTEGQTLLIIEAMKVMNQIRAPHAGKISRVYVADSEPVEYGTALMLIE